MHTKLTGSWYQPLPRSCMLVPGNRIHVPCISCPQTLTCTWIHSALYILMLFGTLFVALYTTVTAYAYSPGHSGALRFRDHRGITNLSETRALEKRFSAPKLTVFDDSMWVFKWLIDLYWRRMSQRRVRRSSQSEWNGEIAKLSFVQESDSGLSSSLSR
jgi:hypothetical protein